ncbi:hypothetical protein LCGC14_2378660, partial [marine sediment metagenome]
LPTNATNTEIPEFDESVSVIPSNGTSTEILPANATIITPYLTKMKDSYLLTEDVEFEFEYYTDENLNKTGKVIKKYNKPVQHDKWEEQDTKITIEVFDPHGDKILLNSEFDEIREGKLNIKLLSEGDHKPGIYKIKTTLTKNGETFTTESEFAWGLVSLNTKKSIYRPGETAEFVIVVLNSEGHPVCDANLSMSVTDPNSLVAKLSSVDGITANAECGLYDAEYITSIEGTYLVDINAVAEGINTNFTTTFDVSSFFEFDIIRTAQSKVDPTKNPNSFDVRIDIESFVGDKVVEIKESIPSVFEVATNANVQTKGDTKILTWNKQLVGDKAYVEYSYSIPLEFPQLYALGPIEINYGDLQTFTEARPWFVAADPISLVATSGITQFTSADPTRTYSVNSITDTIILAVIGTHGGAVSSGVSSNLDGAFTLGRASGTTPQVEIWWLAPSTTGSHTITYTNAATDGMTEIIEFAGVNEDSIGNTAADSGSDGTPTTTINISTADSWAITVEYDQWNNPSVITGGMTQINQNQVGGGTKSNMQTTR